MSVVVGVVAAGSCQVSGVRFQAVGAGFVCGLEFCPMLQRSFVVGIVGLLLVFGSVVNCWGFQDENAGSVPVIEEGVAFPDLLFPRLADGEAGSVRDYRGKKLILHIFASW